MLLAEKKCRYHLDVEKKVNETIFQDEKLMDVEDLLRKGKQAQCCPYFASREFQKTAQVIFTPYNYLLDPKTRKAQDISLFVSFFC
jgi:regulator of telomere elongation helicase 1